MELSKLANFLPVCRSHADPLSRSIFKPPPEQTPSQPSKYSIIGSGLLKGSQGGQITGGVASAIRKGHRSIRVGTLTHVLVEPGSARPATS